MKDFTLLPAAAAQNGYIQNDCDRPFHDAHVNSCRDYCGDFSRVHQDINGNARSLHDSIKTSSEFNLCGQSDLMKDIGDNSRYVGDRVCDSAQSIKSDICGSARDIIDTVHRDGDNSRASADRNGAETRNYVGQAWNDLSSGVERNGLENRNRIEANGAEVRSRVESSSVETRNRVEQNAHEIRDDVQKYGMRNSEVTEKFGFHNSDAIARLSKENALYHKDAILSAEKCCCETQKLVQDKTCAIKEQEAIHATEIKMLQENARIELLRQADTNRLIIERQAADYHGDQKLQASEIYCKLDKTTELAKHEIKLQAAENFAKQEMNSYKQHCELQKQLADCCCDLKELVREKHCETDLQFKNLETERLRADLAQAQREALEARIQPFPYAQCVSLKSCCGNGNGNGNGFPPGQN